MSAYMLLFRLLMALVKQTRQMQASLQRIETKLDSLASSYSRTQEVHVESGFFKTWESRVIGALVALGVVLQLFFAIRTPAPASFGVGAENVNNPVIASGLKCLAGSLNCVEGRNGASIQLYSDNGTTSKFSVNGTTGDIVAAGVITTSGGYVGITPVPTATAITLFMGAAASSYQSCGSTNVTGVATMTPVAGLTPVRVVAGLEAVSGDGAHVAGKVDGSHNIQLNVYNTALTPAANTTPAAVDWCVVGTH